MDLEPDGIVPPDDDAATGNDPAFERIETMLEDGDLEAAIDAIDEALARGGANPTDLLFLRGDACLGLGRAREAERHFRAVLDVDPDCPSSRCWLAMSLFLQWRFDDAEAAAIVARDAPDALIDADIVLASVLERRGDYEQADELFVGAAELAPDRYSPPLRLSRQEFDREVKRAARLLPRQFRQCLDRVPVVVQDVPDVSLVDDDGDEELAPDMLGLFDGVPLPETGEFDGPQMRPNTIYLFQRNLERIAPDREELVEQIRITLWHELGHYLGFEEEDMDDLGLA